MVQRAWIGAAIAALALDIAGAPACAQSDLADRVAQAKQKLDGDIRACRPIDVREYEALDREARQAFNTYVTLKDAGAPVASGKIITETAFSAMYLLEKAQSAAADCAPPANAPKPASAPGPVTGKPPAGPGGTPAVTVPPQSGGSIVDEIAAAGKALDEQIAKCQPIDVAYYRDLEERAFKTFQAVKAAENVGAPTTLSFNQAARAHFNAGLLVDKAKSAVAKGCERPATGELPKPAVPASDPFNSAGQPGTNTFFKALRDGYQAVFQRSCSGKSTSQRPLFCPPPGEEESMATFLAVHNNARLELGLRPLHNNLYLDLSAELHAQDMARERALTHSSRQGRGEIRENLQQGLRGWSAERMLQDWLREEDNFMPGVFPNVARTGDWSGVAHFTEMIWATTTYLGCGEAEGGDYLWLDCNYGPGGNRDGVFVGPVNEYVPAQPATRGEGQAEADRAAAESLNTGPPPPWDVQLGALHEQYEQQLTAFLTAQHADDQAAMRVAYNQLLAIVPRYFRQFHDAMAKAPPDKVRRFEDPDDLESTLYGLGQAFYHDTPVDQPRLGPKGAFEPPPLDPRPLDQL